MSKQPLLVFLFFFSTKLFGLSARAVPLTESTFPLYTGPIYNQSTPENQIDYVRDIHQYINNMSLDEKIGQLFWIDVFSNKGYEEIQETKQLIKKYHVGGIIWFRDTKKATSPALQLTYTNELQSSAKYPLIVSIDGEWGLNMRLDSTIQYPRELQLGALGNDQLVRTFGTEVGKQMKQMGIHFNFAPVVDVNNNPNNPVINDRSFGENKYNVANKGKAYMEGMHQAGILCTAKHFPGHGDTDTDSHKDLPVITHDINRLYDIELYPFQQLINDRLGGIMVAHLNIPTLDSRPNRPTTLSHAVVTDLLINQLGYDGLIVTDAMNMQGVAKHYPNGRAEVEALKAGNDILLYARNVPEAIAEIKRAIQSGELSETRIDKSLYKILSAKRWLGILDKAQQIPTPNVTAFINRADAQRINQKIRQQAITLVKNDNQSLPFTDLGNFQMATVNIDDGSINAFQKALEPYVPIKHFTIRYDAPVSEFLQLQQQLAAYNQVLVSLMAKSRYRSKNFGISNQAKNFLQQLESENKLVLSVFGNPYSLENFASYHELIVAYDDDIINQKTTAEAIFGARPFLGKLPVGVPGIPEGTGIMTQGNSRLIFGSPEEFGLRSSQFYRIDSIAQTAVTQRAAPGCVVLIAKDNKVVYQKAFGYHTYDKKQRTQIDDIFDLASITKIAATLPSIMHDYELGQLSMQTTLSELLPDLKGTNKANMPVGEVLNHTAGLKSWIPFYKSTLEANGKPGKFYRTNAYKGFKKVADNLYIFGGYERDSMIYKIGQAPNNARGRYVYSDLSFYIFKNYFEQKYGQSYDDYINNWFYKHVGFPTFTYNPLNKFPKNRIVPTEEDDYFRHQRIQGYVHDMGAAMTGGVAGHAGLFGSAADLAIYLQLMLNKGTYGSIQYFRPETVDYFTRRYNANSRKGIGFDKPEKDPSKGDGPTAKSASANSFGHTGFTGTFAFADPDNQLMVIFLSNRTYPSMTNKRLLTQSIRPKIQEEAYHILNGVTLD